MALGVVTLFLCVSFVLFGMSSVPAMVSGLVALGYALLILTAAAVMIVGGGGMAPLPYFLIGTAVFFGMGTYFSVTEIRSSLYFTEGQQTHLLPQVNLVNALAIFCATIAAGIFVLRRRHGKELAGTLQDKVDYLLPYFHFILAAAAGVSLIEWLTFPAITNKTFASFMALLEILPAFALFLGGAVWHRLRRFNRAWLVVLIVLTASEGLLSARKVAVIMPFLALSLGLWISERHRFAAIITAFFGVTLYVALLSSVVPHMRSHILYEPRTNTIADRVVIVADIMVTLDEREIEDTENSLLARFSPTQFSAHFIASYDNNFPGDSLDNAFVVLVPRIMWPEKPIINPGKQFDAIWRDWDIFSSLAIGFPAEAYWNEGWMGVVIVSSYIGLMLGWFSWKWFLFRRHGWTHGGIFIVSPLIVKSALWVESNIVGAYIGGWIKIAITVMAIDYSIRTVKFLRERFRASFDDPLGVDLVPKSV